MNDLEEIRRPFDEAREATQAQTRAARTALEDAIARDDDAPRRPTRVLGQRAFGALAVAGLVVVMVALFLAVPGDPPSTIAGEPTPAGPPTVAELLTQLRTSATEDPPTRLPEEDEFSYARTVATRSGPQRRIEQVTFSGRRFSIASSRVESEVWSSGQGRLRIRETFAWEPASDADDAIWRAVGAPDLTSLAPVDDPPNDLVQRSPENTPTRFGLNNGPVNLTSFVGNPAGMAQALRDGFGDAGPDPNTELFTIASDILTATADMPSDVRRTLLEMMLTEVRGIRVDGTPSKDATGRPGVFLTLTRPEPDLREGVLIDVDEARVLARISEGMQNGTPFRVEGAIVARAVVAGIDVRPDGTLVPVVK